MFFSFETCLTDPLRYKSIFRSDTVSPRLEVHNIDKGRFSYILAIVHWPSNFDKIPVHILIKSGFLLQLDSIFIASNFLI